MKSKQNLRTLMEALPLQNPAFPYSILVDSLVKNKEELILQIQLTEVVVLFSNLILDICLFRCCSNFPPVTPI